MLLIVGDINAHHFRWDTNTNEDERGEQLTNKINAADYAILNENEATLLPTNGLTSAWPPMTSHYYQTGKSPAHWPAIIYPSSSPSTPNCTQLIGLGEPTSTSRKQTGHVMLKHSDTNNKYLAEADKTRTVKQAENAYRKAVKSQWPLHSDRRHHQHFNTSNQPCQHQPNRSPMN